MTDDELDGSVEQSEQPTESADRDAIPHDSKSRESSTSKPAPSSPKSTQLYRYTCCAQLVYVHVSLHEYNTLLQGFYTWPLLKCTYSAYTYIVYTPLTISPTTYCQ